MGYSQLFIKKPDIDIINDLLKCINIFNIYNIDVNTEFNEFDMKKTNTLIAFQNLKNRLLTYYLPCKQYHINNNINTYKGFILILRQFLKIVNYTISSKQKYINGKKYLNHKIITIDTHRINKTKIKNTPVTITFD